MNPNEPLKQQVYVYNAIFFSYAVDDPYSYKDLTSKDQFPSYTQSNHDLTGLHLLQTIENLELHHLATCLVNFKGTRIICQSIIPGILNNSDLASLAEYGTVDENKKLVATEQFHELMLKVADSLSIKVNKVIDPSNGKSIEIAGSVDVKGIEGSDKRNYVVDLQGLMPRDANFKGDDFHSCLVRPELVKQIQRTKALEHAQSHMKEFNEKLEKERVPDPEPEEGKELTADQKRSIIESRKAE